MTKQSHFAILLMRLKLSREIGTAAVELIVYLRVGRRHAFCDQNVELYFQNGRVE